MTQNHHIIGFHLPDEPYGFMSNWYLTGFTLARHSYVSSEQYMMCRKVLTKHRYDLADQIMETSDPAEAQRLAGRNSFTDIDPKMWDKVSYAVVKQGVSAKFRQNTELANQLLATDEALLCECSRSDTRWGIGINHMDQSYFDVTNWKGSNYLGRILMEVRDEIRITRLRNQPDFVDACHLPPISEWRRTAGELRLMPKYHAVIAAYADTLPNHLARQAFFHSPLDSVEFSMNTNMGGGLPGIGFYELKQDIYDIARMTADRDNLGQFNLNP